MRSAGSAAALSLALAGGAWSMSAAAPRLTGLLTIGPSCAGPEREGQPCPSAPFVDVTVQLLDEDGRVVAQGVSDSQGRFVIPALPGRYRAQVLVPKVTRCPSPAVELPRQGLGVLLIDCDNGRR